MTPDAEPLKELARFTAQNLQITGAQRVASSQRASLALFQIPRRKADMRVLIVDDSRANRMILEKMLKDLGLETVEAESGADAMWFLGEDPNIDLITVDYHMPKMTGVQFVRLLREKPEFKSTPILMISMEARPEIRAQALEAGVNDFLEKPFTEEIIAEKLRSLGITPPGSPNPPEGSARP